jgi:hypothetical protein
MPLTLVADVIDESVRPALPTQAASEADHRIANNLMIIAASIRRTASPTAYAWCGRPPSNCAAAAPSSKQRSDYARGSNYRRRWATRRATRVEVRP